MLRYPFQTMVMPYMKSSLHFLVAARQHEIVALEQLDNACSLVVSMSGLVHALQRERGLSNMLLASGGVQGHDLLRAQQEQVNAEIAVVRQELEQLGPCQPGGHGARLCNAIAYSLQGWNALPALRAQVQTLRMTPDENTRHYIRLISGCLSVVFEAADSANEPALSRMLVAMFHFMQGKELTGQERATGTAVFASGVYDADRQVHWLHLIESQERNFQVFTDLATESARSLWQSQAQDDADMAAMERLRRVANTAPVGAPLDVGLSAQWFAICTRRLDAMFAIEVAMAQELQALCRHKLDAARDALQAQQRLLAPDDGMDISAASEAGMHFFADAPVPLDWPLEAVCTPPIGRAILLLVQEQSQRLQTMQAEIQQAKTALHERKTIERAKGILMQHQQMSEGAAHQFLRQTAMNQNKRMLEVADAVLAMVAILPRGPVL